MTRLPSIKERNRMLPVPKPIEDMTVGELEIAAYAYELGQADYQDMNITLARQRKHGDTLYVSDFSMNPYVIEEVTHE